MKLLPALLLLNSLSLGQTILNASFEMVRDTNPLLPQGWKIDRKAGYRISLDTLVAKSGRSSLLIASATDTTTGQCGFSQNLPVQVTQPTLVHLRGFIKTDHPGAVGVWWNSWRDDKHRGFAHSQQQITLNRTTDWQPFNLVLATSTDINRYSLGAYLRGAGNVWFDDLRLELTPAATGEPAARVKDYLQKAVALVKKHALVRDSIPWQQTQAELLAYARGLRTEAETYPLIGHLLTIMRQHGDNHSFFLNPQEAMELKADHSTDEQAEEPEPQARYLGDGVGYVLVPAFQGVNQRRETAFATRIQALISQVDSAESISGWVVDLRGNTGGNVWPMIAGLVPLYGKNAKRSYRRVTKVQYPYRLRQAPGRIAVLLDAQTASSGEFTALSFIGLPHVRTFGQHSAGYTTGNADYKLSDGARLFLARSIGEDRAGRQYRHGITPDEEIKAVSTPISDPALEAATAWLLKK